MIVKIFHSGKLEEIKTLSVHCLELVVKKNRILNLYFTGNLTLML